MSLLHHQLHREVKGSLCTVKDRIAQGTDGESESYVNPKEETL